MSETPMTDAINKRAEAAEARCAELLMERDNHALRRMEAESRCAELVRDAERQWIPVSERLPEPDDAVWGWYPGMANPVLDTGRRVRVWGSRDDPIPGAVWQPAYIPSAPAIDAAKEGKT